MIEIAASKYSVAMKVRLYIAALQWLCDQPFVSKLAHCNAPGAHVVALDVPWCHVMHKMAPGAL